MINMVQAIVLTIRNVLIFFIKNDDKTAKEAKYPIISVDEK